MQPWRRWRQRSATTPRAHSRARFGNVTGFRPVDSAPVIRGALGEKLTRFHDGRTQRETDSTAVIKARKAAPVGGLSFIFKQADHVAYWHLSDMSTDPEKVRLRGK